MTTEGIVSLPVSRFPHSTFMIFRTHCAVRLGDNLLALHLIRGFAKAHPEHRFVHYAHLQYISQLAEVVCDLPNLQVCSLETVASDDTSANYWGMTPRCTLNSVDLWKNAPGGGSSQSGFWEKHPLKLDYAQFALALGVKVGAQLGLTSPWRVPADLLFDYPALLAGTAKPFDVLVINSAPQSGQVSGFRAEEMTLLVGELARRYVVVTTAPTGIAGVGCTQHQGLTVTGVGILSRFCRVIVMVSTGPSWPTFNAWNRQTVEHRVILLENERVELAPNTVHVSNAGEARKVLQLRGVL